MRRFTASVDDFVEKTQNVTFYPGETGPMSIPIDIIDDKIVEETERFIVFLSSKSPATTVGKPAFVNIIDNDGNLYII